MGRVVASSANWEELKPWGTLAGFRWSLIPAVQSHTGRCTTLGKTYVMYHLGKESETVEARVAVDGRGVTMSGRGTRQVQGRRKGLESDSAHISHTPGEPHLAHLGNFARCQTNTSFVHILHVLHLVQVLTYIACSNKQNQNCQIFKADIK